MKTTFIWPDTHAPIQDRRAVGVALQALRQLRPDHLILIGDFVDCTAPARWSRGLAEEYVCSLPEEMEAGKALLTQIRAVYDGPISFIIGNHEERIENYVAKHAPALRGIVPSIGQLLDFEGFGVVHQEQPYVIAPGVRAIHGLKLSSTQNAAGQSAYKERMRHGHSIVQGHTHRLGIGWDTQERSRFWLEAGCLIDFKKADYIPFLNPNWQQGFALLHEDRQRVWPEVVPIHNGRAIVHGQQLAA